MHTAPTYLTTPELEQGLADVMASPTDQGRLEAIFVRLGVGERSSLSSAMLSPDEGVDGDRWASNHWQKLPDGRPDPQSQVSLMNVRLLRLIAGCDDAMCLAGDNLALDLDLSAANLPSGSRLGIGDEVVLEFTTQKHTGCNSFAHRYGQEAREFVNGPRGKPLNLRGRFARVVQGGTVHVGDAVFKIN
jgi:hypothetical protein